MHIIPAVTTVLPVASTTKATLALQKATEEPSVLHVPLTDQPPLTDQTKNTNKERRKKKRESAKKNNAKSVTHHSRER